MAASAVDALDKLTTMPLVLDQTLGKSISLPLSSTLSDLLSGNPDGTFKRKSLQRGERASFFVGDGASLPKEVKTGDLLLGKLDLVDSKKLDGPLYQVQYLVPPEANTSSESSTTEPKKDDRELLKEAVRDLEISWLKKVKSDDFKKELLDRLEKENPQFLPIYRQHLETLFSKLDKSEGAPDQEHVDLCRQVISVCEHILSIVSVPDLAMYFGVHHENVTPEEKELSQKRDKEKDALVYALVAKTQALRDLNELVEPLNLTLAGSETIDAFDKSLDQLSQWVGDKPLNHGRYLLLWTWQQKRQGFFGTPLKSLQKYLSDSKKSSGSPDSDEVKLWRKLSALKMTLLGHLKWDLWETYEKRWNLVKFPKEFARF